MEREREREREEVEIPIRVSTLCRIGKAVFIGDSVYANVQSVEARMQLGIEKKRIFQCSYNNIKTNVQTW